MRSWSLSKDSIRRTRRSRPRPRGGRHLATFPARGIWVALATFIPTFLAIVIGVPHFLTSALAPHATEPRVPVSPLSATVALPHRPHRRGGQPTCGPRSSPHRARAERGRAVVRRPSWTTRRRHDRASRPASWRRQRSPRPRRRTPSPHRPRTAPGLRQPPLETTKRRPGSRARCTIRDIVWTCVMKSLPRGHGWCGSRLARKIEGWMKPGLLPRASLGRAGLPGNDGDVPGANRRATFSTRVPQIGIVTPRGQWTAS